MLRRKYFFFEWKRCIAIKLNAMGDEVTSRSVRDQYNNMSKKYRARVAREERSTGEGGSELTERGAVVGKSY